MSALSVVSNQQEWIRDLSQYIQQYGALLRWGKSGGFEPVPGAAREQLEAMRAEEMRLSKKFAQDMQVEKAA